MKNRPYDLASVTGRFQSFHIGHEHIIDTALKLADRVLVFVGSAQAIGDELRNPFNVATRIQMIEHVYESNVIVRALPDMTTEDDICPEWGRYVLNACKQAAFKLPEIMVYGNDEARSGWFDPQDIKGITEVIVSRATIPISATQMRQYLHEGNRDAWMKFTNPHLHKYYDRMRSELLNSIVYTNLSKEVKSWLDQM